LWVADITYRRAAYKGLGSRPTDLFLARGS
jgi:hypothetical protein